MFYRPVNCLFVPLLACLVNFHNLQQKWLDSRFICNIMGHINCQQNENYNTIVTAIQKYSIMTCEDWLADWLTDKHSEAVDCGINCQQQTSYCILPPDENTIVNGRLAEKATRNCRRRHHCPSYPIDEEEEDEYHDNNDEFKNWHWLLTFSCLTFNCHSPLSCSSSKFV